VVLWHGVLVLQKFLMARFFPAVAPFVAVACMGCNPASSSKSSPTQSTTSAIASMSATVMVTTPKPLLIEPSAVSDASAPTGASEDASAAVGSAYLLVETVTTGGCGVLEWGPKRVGVDVLVVIEPPASPSGDKDKNRATKANTTSTPRPIRHHAMCPPNTKALFENCSAYAQCAIDGLTVTCGKDTFRLENDAKGLRLIGPKGERVIDTVPRTITEPRKRNRVAAIAC
jgi:hypothetical protein